MSWLPSKDPVPGDNLSCDAIEHVIVPRARDLGGFEVRRALPSAQKQMVGPFIFFDQMGPAEFLIGNGIDVRPHPHIGLATVTYPVRGRGVPPRQPGHRRSPIRPGEVNLMTAGRGIVHSERETSEPTWSRGPRPGSRQAAAGRTSPVRHPGLGGAAEERMRSRRRHSPTTAPTSCRASPARARRVRLVMGSAYGAGRRSCFRMRALFAEAVLAPGAVLPLDADYDERAVYVASGEIDIAGELRRRASAGVQDRATASRSWPLRSRA